MQEIAEYEQGTLKRIYVYGSYIDEPLMMMPVGGGPVKKYYYHANNLYNVTAITDKNGAVVERYNYSPYGEATILDAAGTTVLGASTIANPWTFTGRRLDAETGLMYYRAKYYDVDLGRFVGRDPLGYVDGLSLYEYARTRPTTMIDSFGLSAISAVYSRDTFDIYEADPRNIPGGDTVWGAPLHINVSSAGQAKTNCERYCKLFDGKVWKFGPTGDSRKVHIAEFKQDGVKAMWSTETKVKIPKVPGNIGAFYNLHTAVGKGYDIWAVSLDEYRCTCCGNLWAWLAVMDDHEPTSVDGPYGSVFVYDPTTEVVSTTGNKIDLKIIEFTSGSGNEK
jgi:RHS repeat-associated protein